MHKVIS